MPSALTKHILVHIVFVMKIRIALYLISLALWGFLRDALFAPALVVAQNTAAVATVNGGDAAFVAQQSLSTGASYPITLVVVVALTVAFWFNPVKSALTSSSRETK